jgi:hypothetical protein
MAKADISKASPLARTLSPRNLRVVDIADTPLINA